MDARLIRRTKRLLPGGYIIEIVIWAVPHPVPGSSHLYKYRLFFGRAGARLVGYDNERGKGDHRHSEATERPYRFVGMAELLADFEADIREYWRRE